MTAAIVLTRHDGDRFGLAAIAAIAAGADDSLVKGGHDAQLGTAVRRAVQRVRAPAPRSRPARAADSPTCAVDGDGVVVSVNALWRAFTAANSGEGPLCRVGVDYLAACDDAVGERYDGAVEVADAPGKVHGDEVDGFELEYSCHGPGQQRWSTGTRSARCLTSTVLRPSTRYSWRWRTA